MAPRVYIETSVVSYLTARASRDLIVAGHQQITEEWWRTRRPHFDLYVSQLILREAGDGDEEAAADALHISTAAVHGVEYLLTWNMKHIANAEMRPLIERACRRQGIEPPVLCTPEQLMGG